MQAHAGGLSRLRARRRAARRRSRPICARCSRSLRSEAERHGARVEVEAKGDLDGQGAADARSSAASAISSPTPSATADAIVLKATREQRFVDDPRRRRRAGHRARASRGRVPPVPSAGRGAQPGRRRLRAWPGHRPRHRPLAWRRHHARDQPAGGLRASVGCRREPAGAAAAPVSAGLRRTRLDGASPRIHHPHREERRLGEARLERRGRRKRKRRHRAGVLNTLNCLTNQTARRRSSGSVRSSARRRSWWRRARRP